MQSEYLEATVTTYYKLQLLHKERNENFSC